MRISDWSSTCALPIFLVGRYTDGADQIDIAIAVYADQHEGKELVSFGAGVLREDDVWVRVQNQPPIAGGSVLRITHPVPVERIVATWYVVGVVVTHSPNRAHLQPLQVLLTGGAHPPAPP